MAPPHVLLFESLGLILLPAVVPAVLSSARGSRLFGVHFGDTTWEGSLHVTRTRAHPVRDFTFASARCRGGLASMRPGFLLISWPGASPNCGEYKFEPQTTGSRACCSEHPYLQHTLATRTHAASAECSRAPSQEGTAPSRSLALQGGSPPGTCP